MTDTTPAPIGADALRAVIDEMRSKEARGAEATEHELGEMADRLTQALEAYTAQAAPAAVAGHEVLCWVPEDELPESITSDAYNTLFQYSRVDGIRWFPVFGQSAQTTQETPPAVVEPMTADGLKQPKNGEPWPEREDH